MKCAVNNKDSVNLYAANNDVVLYKIACVGCRYSNTEFVKVLW